MHFWHQLKKENNFQMKNNDIFLISWRWPFSFKTGHGTADGGCGVAAGAPRRDCCQSVYCRHMLLLVLALQTDAAGRAGTSGTGYCQSWYPRQRLYFLVCIAQRGWMMDSSSFVDLLGRSVRRHLDVLGHEAFRCLHLRFTFIIHPINIYTYTFTPSTQLHIRFVCLQYNKIIQ